jgi:hypothetical protein
VAGRTTDEEDHTLARRETEGQPSALALAAPIERQERVVESMWNYLGLTSGTVEFGHASGIRSGASYQEVGRADGPRLEFR